MDSIFSGRGQTLPADHLLNWIGWIFLPNQRTGPRSFETLQYSRVIICYIGLAGTFSCLWRIVSRSKKKKLTENIEPFFIFLVVALIFEAVLHKQPLFWL